MLSCRDFWPLRADQELQDHLAGIAKSASKEWSARSQVSLILDDLERYATTRCLDYCPHLSAVLTDLALAKEFVASFATQLIRMLGDEPLALPDIGHNSSRTFATVQLARSHQAELSVTCFDRREFDPREMGTVTIVDCERHEIVLKGLAVATVVQADQGAASQARLKTMQEQLAEGDVFQTGAQFSNKARILSRIEKPLTILRLVLQPSNPSPTLDIRLSDGSVVSQSSGSKHTSCQEVMMATLGRMGRKDAVPAMAQLARDGCDHLRWEAIRQCLALDFRKGFGLLCEVAREPAEPLSHTASALRGQLIEAHPQLAKLERELCLA